MTKLSPINSTDDLAGSILGELCEILLSFEAAARMGDADAIHEMRVTVRRLRVAVANFRCCVNRESRSSLKDRLTQLAEHLGAVRDLDVLMDELAKALSSCPATDQRYLRAMIKRLRDRRRRRVHRLIRLLDSRPLETLPAEIVRQADQSGTRTVETPLHEYEFERLQEVHG